MPTLLTTAAGIYDRSMSIRVEFYGIVRSRAETDVVELKTDGGEISLAELLQQLADRFPALAETCFEGKRLRAGYTTNIEGQRFVDDPNTVLRDGQSLLLMSIDAGG